MSIAALMFVENPNPMAVGLLAAGQGWTVAKMGTQMAYNLTPERFYMARSFLGMYNLAILFSIWYKLREGRNEKM